MGECGEAYVWGWNSDGQLGLPSKTPSGTIETLKHFCSCRISNDAEGNSSAQSASVDKCADSLDTISSTQESVNVQSTPEMVQVFGDSNVVEVAAGDRHSLFLMGKNNYLFLPTFLFKLFNTIIIYSTFPTGIVLSIVYEL